MRRCPLTIPPIRLAGTRSARDSALTVNPNAVLPLPVALEGFQPKTRQSEVAQRCRCVEYFQPDAAGLLDRLKTPDKFPLQQALCIRVQTGTDHTLLISRYSYWAGGRRVGFDIVASRGSRAAHPRAALPALPAQPRQVCIVRHNPVQYRLGVFQPCPSQQAAPRVSRPALRPMRSGSSGAPRNCRAAVSAILWLPPLRRLRTGQSTKPRSFACRSKTRSALWGCF